MSGGGLSDGGASRANGGAVAPLPFAITVCGIDELAGHGASGVSHVLSILDPAHPVPEAFGAWGEHEKLELRFDDVIEEGGVLAAPVRSHVASILAFGRDLMAEPAGTRHLLVHCHAGISRSTASMVLILAQALPDEPAEAIVARVHAIREKAWPNLRIVEIGDEMLGRGGALVRAVTRLHRMQLARRPELGEMMAEAGRTRELGLAARAG